MNIRLFAAVSSVSAIAAAIVACSSPAEAPQPTEHLGQQQEGICLNYPCTGTTTYTNTWSTSSGLVATSGGTVYQNPTFTCKGKVAGTSYYYQVQPDGRCAIVDPNGCKDAGGTSNLTTTTQSDGGCWGSTIISYYICPVNHPNISCDGYTGVCSCY